MPRPSIDQLITEAFQTNGESHQTAELQAATKPQPIAEMAVEVPREYPIDPLPVIDSSGATRLAISDGGEELPLPPADEFPLFEADYVETPLTDVLVEFADATGLEFVIDDKTDAVINISFEPTDVDDALTRILLPHPIHFRRRGKQVVVTQENPASPLFQMVSIRKQYQPRFLEPEALLELVPDSSKDYVKVVPGTKSLLVEAPPRIVEPIIERFQEVDQPVPQVALEAIICVISPDTAHQFGLDWSHAVELNSESAFRLGLSGLGIGIDVTQAGVNELFGDFSKTAAFVNALSEHGYLTIRAAPHVMAQDGEQATISINRETFFTVQPPNAAGGDSSAFFFQQEIQNVQAGISLDITPRIHRDMVTVKIEKAEVSEDVRTANADAALNPFPVINRRNVSTTVSVHDGRTIVIGGLVQRETVDRESLVPGLGRLPMIGHLFRTTQRQTRDAEVVIFLSPRIVRGNVLPVCAPATNTY